MSTAAVKFSTTPSCMIFTLVARNRSRPAASARRATSSGICSRPRSRSHHSAPTTWAMIAPRSASLMEEASRSGRPWTTPIIASCHPVTPQASRRCCATRNASSISSSVVGGSRSETRSIAPSCSIPIAAPEASRSMRPSAGSGVVAVTPARSRRGRVHPGAVPVAVVQVGGPAAGHGVERGRGRHPAGERLHRPAAAADPLELRVRSAVRGDPVEVLGRAAGVGEVEPEEVDARVVRVDVRVLEAGRHEAAMCVQLRGPGPCALDRVPADRRDRAVLHQQRRRPRRRPA